MKQVLFTTPESLPKDFATFRHLAELSQKEVGKRTHYSQQIISKLETGDRFLHYDQVFAIAKAMGIDELRVIL